MQVPFSYLDRQFANVDDYLGDIRALVTKGMFTLGASVEEFEQRFAELIGMPYAIGVGSGTDAIAMSLTQLGVGVGDEVITTPNTFIATVGGIVMTGARPVFVDSENGYVINADKMEEAITPKTRAIVPVHYTGNMADMPRIMEIAERHNLVVVEDACTGILASIDGRKSASWGHASAFSLHPLKNLNVWSDGGVIVTGDETLAENLKLYRNHGLIDRDKVVSFGRNCRLDTIQAAVGNRLIGKTEEITQRRIEIASQYDAAFSKIDEIDVPVRRTGVRHVFHLYVLRVERRDELLGYLGFTHK